MFKIKLISSKFLVISFLLLNLGCSQDIKVSETKLNQVKVGDTQEDVRNLLGKPIEVRKYEFRGNLEEAWTYSQVSMSSTNQQVIFDAEKGTVLKVIHLE